MRQIVLLMGFSIVLFSFLGCNTTVARPDSNVCIVNVPSLQKACHNLKTDYDDNGNLLPGKPAIIHKYVDYAAMLADLNKNMSIDPASTASLKAYIRDLRGACQ